MSEQLLEIAELTAGYERATVIRSVNLRVGAGEVVALLGANGAGKTTTLRVISGIVAPMMAAVEVLGRDVARSSPVTIARAAVAHVAEGRSVFFELTVGEHFRLGHRGDASTPSTRTAYFPQLRELRDRRAGLLSGGEQQMLALSRALARWPRLLLVDELSLGPAPVMVQRMLAVVRAYATDTGAGVLLVEQHVELALDVAHRGVVMSHGEVVLERPAHELRGDRRLLAASYLGEAAAPSA